MKTKVNRKEKPEDQVPLFEQEAHAARTGLVSEFWSFLKHSKKWWLLPILVMLFLMSLLIALGYSGLAPFIYTLF